MKSFILPGMTFRGDSGSQQCHHWLDFMDFLIRERKSKLHLFPEKNSWYQKGVRGLPGGEITHPMNISSQTQRHLCPSRCLRIID